MPQLRKNCNVVNSHTILKKKKLCDKNRHITTRMSHNQLSWQVQQNTKSQWWLVFFFRAIKRPTSSLLMIYFICQPIRSSPVYCQPPYQDSGCQPHMACVKVNVMNAPGGFLDRLNWVMLYKLYTLKSAREPPSLKGKTNQCGLSWSGRYQIKLPVSIVSTEFETKVQVQATHLAQTAICMYPHLGEL